MNDVFFTADLHLGHHRIMEYCARPFKSHQEMTEVIIARTNEVCGSGDRLYVLGDVAFSTFDPQYEYLDRLKCKQVHLIIGNHDQTHPRCLRAHWASMHELQVVRLKPKITLCHYSMQTWPGQHGGSLHAFGHSHGRLIGLGRSMDVGVDTNQFRPYEFSELKQILGEREIL